MGELFTPTHLILVLSFFFSIVDHPLLADFEESWVSSSSQPAHSRSSLQLASSVLRSFCQMEDRIAGSVEDRPGRIEAQSFV